jgi:hypothetical protein
MAYSRHAARLRIWQIEAQLTDRLISLLAFDAPAVTRAAWQRELRTALARLAMVRLKPDARPIPEEWLWRWLRDGLDDDPMHVDHWLDDCAEPGLRRGPRCGAEIADRIESFYRTLAGRLARGEEADNLIEELGR